jgi:thiol-disulfide isomerase/thioredoxin
MNRRSLRISAFSLLVLVAWSTALQADDDTSKLIGRTAPDFSLKTVDGKTVKLSDEKGKVVLVDFWATWCGPCMASMPHIQKLSADQDLKKKGLIVWAVNDQESRDDVQKLLDSKGYTMMVPMDSDGKVEQDYFVTGIPTTIVVGKNGVVKFVQVGYGDGVDKVIEDAINSALDE